MVQPTENGQCDHPARSALRGAFRHPLRDPLVRSRRVVVSDVLGKPSTHLPLGEDEDRVQAFAAYAPDEAFAEGVRFRRSNGRLQHPRAAGLGHHVENPVELVVAVAHEKRGRSHHGVALRSCCAVHCVLGYRVTLKCTADAELLSSSPPSVEWDPTNSSPGAHS